MRLGTLAVVGAMSALIWLVILLLILPAYGYSPTNPPVEIQPDEIFMWECEMGVSLQATGLSVTAVYLAQMSSGQTVGQPCVGLITGPTVTGTKVQWTFTPASLNATKEHVCWVHVLAETAAGGFKKACDGKITVRRNKPAT
jgi:hypothetical protein